MVFLQKRNKICENHNWSTTSTKEPLAVISPFGGGANDKKNIYEIVAGQYNGAKYLHEGDFLIVPGLERNYPRDISLLDCIFQKIRIDLFLAVKA
jgi:hypothetical protein